MFGGDTELAKAYGCVLEPSAKGVEHEAEEDIGAMDTEERELYDLLDATYSERKREPVPISTFILRDMESLIKVGLSQEYMYSHISYLPNFSFRTFCEHKKVLIWSEKIYRIRSHTSQNVVLLLPNGCLMVDLLPGIQTLSNNFRKYLKKVRVNFTEDVQTAKAIIDTCATCHSLDQYYFVPYLKNGAIHLHIPILREYPKVGRMSLKRFLSELLGI